MKGWFAASVGLSGLILAWLLFSMESCGRTYEIDEQGRLLEGLASAMKPADRVGRPAHRWDVAFPQFSHVASHVRPGDQLDQTITTAGYPLMAVSMSTLRVIRSGRVILTARDGALKFWGAIVGVPAVPLFVWGVAAFWIALAPRPRPAPG